MKEPVDHIVRPTLPWRHDSDGAITECGIAIDETRVITREEYHLRLKDWGQQRTSLHTCMTCATTAGRWGDWDKDPRLAIGREIEWERGSAYYRDSRRGRRLKDELVAIASLIESHRDEFDAILAENERRREWLEKKAALNAKPKQQASRGL